MAAWSKLEDGTLLLQVSCVAYGHPHDNSDGWVGGVPPLRHTPCSRYVGLLGFIDDFI